MTQTTDRKFSPIFTADVTFGEVIEGTTRKGVAYARSRSTVAMKGGVVSRQVMAFGDQLESIREHFVEGKTVLLAVQHDAGTLKALGLPRPDQRKNRIEAGNDNAPLEDALEA